MKILVKHIEFQVSSQIYVQKKIIEYFRQSGFELTYEGRNELRFSRGNIFTNFITFNPLRWKSKTSVNINENNVKVHVDINTTGQTVNIAEDKLWDTFLNNLQLFLMNNIDFNRINKIELKRTKKESVKFLWKAASAGFTGDFSDVRKQVIKENKKHNNTR
ncbi:MAG: hypothetical protein GC181_09735 [Bacteroidetes bacterium]|nr:hypothetical protein [Bacteroidota bacterium]